MRWLICLSILLSGCVVVKAPSRIGGLKGIVTLHAAEVEYYSDYGRFATSMRELGPGDLASGEKDGYKFTLTATPGGYAISAVPDHPGAAGRTYFSDQSMGIHVHNGPEPATVNDPLQGGTAPPLESDPVAPRRDKTNS